MKAEHPSTGGICSCFPTNTLGDAAPLLTGLISRPAARGRGARLDVTLGELVEAVSFVTVNLGEQALVLDHILRTRGAKLGFRRVEVVA